MGDRDATKYQDSNAFIGVYLSILYFYLIQVIKESSIIVYIQYK